MDVGLTDLPLAGRAGELAVVRDFLQTALGGTGGAVVLCGEPGVGKTRLVQELTAELPDDVLVLRGYGIDLPGMPELRPPFGVLVDALRWVDQDLPEPLRSDMAAWIDPPTAADIEPVHLRHTRLLGLMDTLTPDCGTLAAKPFFIRACTGVVHPRATVLGNEFEGVVEVVGSG